MKRTRGRPIGYVMSGKKYPHTTISCTPEQWERLSYLSAPSGKKLATWLKDKVLSYDGEVKELDKTKEKKVIRSLCFEEEAFELMKKKAIEHGMSFSSYVLSIGLTE